MKPTNEQIAGEIISGYGNCPYDVIPWRSTLVIALNAKDDDWRKRIGEAIEWIESTSGTNGRSDIVEFLKQKLNL